MLQKQDIQIVSAGSILGLKPSGVEGLPEALLSNGLLRRINALDKIITVENYNSLYSFDRDKHTRILNGDALRKFSIGLYAVIQQLVSSKKFALVLGGDCSILIGITSALKALGTCGLFFIDAHADFYEPEQSTTGEVADMDLAFVTGRGPDILTNLNDARPYVKDEHVVHIGQRDMEETRKFNSQEIRSTAIKCFDLPTIREVGVFEILKRIDEHVTTMSADSFWIHFDTDVLADDINPAVEYRLPGGLSWDESEMFLKTLINNYPIVGISVSVFNPKFDPTGKIAEALTSLLTKVLN
jgi:arginase